MEVDHRITKRLRQQLRRRPSISQRSRPRWSAQTIRPSIQVPTSLHRATIQRCDRPIHPSQVSAQQLSQPRLSPRVADEQNVPTQIERAVRRADRSTQATHLPAGVKDDHPST